MKTEILNWIDRQEDFYIEDGEVPNRFYNACLNDLKYFIEHSSQIKEQPIVNDGEWISVKERMPELKHLELKTQFLVLGYFQINDLKGTDFYDVSRLSTMQYEFNKMILFESRSNYNITHWKEIQKPNKNNDN
jgi:hypothetical protein